MGCVAPVHPDHRGRRQTAGGAWKAFAIQTGVALKPTPGSPSGQSLLPHARGCSKLTDMNRRSFLSLGAAAACARGAQDKTYPLRWVYVSRSLARDSDVDDIRAIARTASQHGLNGILLAAGLDHARVKTADHERIVEIKKICAEYKLEIIPLMFSIGYGSAILSYDHNLAEGLPVRDALFVARGGVAQLQPDPPVAIANGGFEEHDQDRLKNFRMQDGPGVVSFVDSKVSKAGGVSLRLENFQPPHGHARVMQEIDVRPNRCYRVTCQVRTEGLQPDGAFRIMVLSPSGREIAPYEPGVESTTDWRRLELGFNSMSFDKVRIYAGVWGGRAGKCWIDDLNLEEVGLVNVLRRPGTPLRVRSDAKETVYQEGRDYEAIADPHLTFRFDHDGPPIRLTANSRIADGERLRVDYYHGMSIHHGQVTACMSEPKVYEVMAEQARQVNELLAPSKFMFSMDEIRAGGSCLACKQRNLGMAQILGDCITRQTEIVRKLNPRAEVFIWSDMLDPNHNAHGNYYLVDGDFTGSHNFIPKDLHIVCWYYEKRHQSLQFFSGLGYRTLAGAYYDGSTLQNPQGWLEELDATPKAEGIMYTTWRNQYELLGPFGDLVSRRG